MTRRRVREVFVVHDAACGVCSGVASDLTSLLRVPVRTRSCRDPDLRAAHPDVPAVAATCRTPAVGLVSFDGTVTWRLGVGAARALLGLVRPRALPRAVRVLATVRRTSRARAADHR